MVQFFHSNSEDFSGLHCYCLWQSLCSPNTSKQWLCKEVRCPGPSWIRLNRLINSSQTLQDRSLGKHWQAVFKKLVAPLEWLMCELVFWGSSLFRLLLGSAISAPKTRSIGATHAGSLAAKPKSDVDHPWPMPHPRDKIVQSLEDRAGLGSRNCGCSGYFRKKGMWIFNQKSPSRCRVMPHPQALRHPTSWQNEMLAVLFYDITNPWMGILGLPRKTTPIRAMAWRL